jgi:hypothetical protein
MTRVRPVTPGESGLPPDAIASGRAIPKIIRLSLVGGVFNTGTTGTRQKRLLDRIVFLFPARLPAR